MNNHDGSFRLMTEPILLRSPCEEAYWRFEGLLQVERKVRLGRAQQMITWPDSA